VRDQDHAHFRCKLRYHWEYGGEGKFFKQDDLLIRQRSDTKAMAVQWPTFEREASSEAQVFPDAAAFIILKRTSLSLNRRTLSSFVIASGLLSAEPLNRNSHRIENVFDPSPSVASNLSRHGRRQKFCCVNKRASVDDT
jgi:hypothetical protein